MSILISKQLSLLKSSLSLAGNVNQALNQYWCVIIKPTLPSHFVKIVGSADSFSTDLFGESLTKKMIDYKKKVESNTFWKTHNQHHNNHTGKGLIKLFRIHPTTSPLQRPRRGPTKDKITNKSQHMLRTRTNNSEDHFTNQNSKLSPFLPWFHGK